jgi:hypothetical protein
LNIIAEMETYKAKHTVAHLAIAVQMVDVQVLVAVQAVQIPMVEQTTQLEELLEQLMVQAVLTHAVVHV